MLQHCGENNFFIHELLKLLNTKLTFVSALDWLFWIDYIG